jgi:hypothetical protein
MNILEVGELIPERFSSILSHEWGGESSTTPLHIGKGWFPIIWTLCSSIENYYNNRSLNGKEPLEPVKISTIKEKFGTLRVYHQGGDEAVDAMISFAESMSCVTCEVCGSTEDVFKSSGWVSRRCLSCIPEGDKKEWKPVIWGKK